MNLQEFIKTALVEIVAGVTEAREEISEHGATVGSDPVYGETLLTDSQGRRVSSVDFDIALAEGSGTETSGGIGVFLGAVGIGTQAASHGEASSHSRIKFSVPIVLPGEARQQQGSY